MLLDYYHKARGTGLETAGRTWYANAGAECARLAAAHGVAHATAAGIVAALSPRMPWARNITEAGNLLAGRTCAALGVSVRKAERIHAGEDPAAVLATGPKTLAFWRALCGDLDAVVLDVWMLRAFGHDRDTVTPYQYRLLSETVRQTARSVACAPATFQAIVWCAIRGSAN